MQTLDLGGISVMVVEDEPLLRKQMAAALEKLGIDVTSAGTLQAAEQMAGELSFDFVLLDVNLPDGLGTNLLKNKVFPPNTGVIVMTAHGGVNGAVEAIKLGAIDYLVKPFDLAELPLVISRGRRARQKAREYEHKLGDETSDGFYFGSALAGLQAQLEKILAADRRMQSALSPVLIVGETGTGKSTIARWIHHQGPRASMPLIEVNCSALPESLAESELFGHERGAFTDARVARMGLIEAASGGTLFLDELPSLSPGLQAKVLMALEDRRIRRVGGNKAIAVDVRIIAATNRDLKKAVAEGQFREDLYHRLDLFHINISPLRERGEDILHLVELLMDRLCRRHRLAPKQITPLGKERLMGYPWPGNVRELAHELERAIVFEEGESLYFEHLFAATQAAGGAAMKSNDWFNTNYFFPEIGFVMEDAINRIIQHALKQTHGNVSAAARILGVTRDYLRYRLTDTKPPESGE